MIRRYLHILLTCRLGFHAPYLERAITHDLKMRECPRCHKTVVISAKGGEYAFNKPNSWDVARGLYDRPQGSWGDKP